MFFLIFCQCPHIEGERNQINKNAIKSPIFREQSCVSLPALCLFLASFILLPWGWRRHVSPRRQLTFTRLHGVVSQNMGHFTTTVGRTSNHAENQVVIVNIIHITLRLRNILVLLRWSRDSVVGVATGYRLDDRGFRVLVPVGSRIFSSSHPDRLWGPPNLLPNGYRGLFPQE
jgi:hypothetical protein